MCKVRLIHKDKSAKCRRCVVPGDGPPLLGMPENELLDILKIMCEVVGDQQADRKLESQTIQPSNSPRCKANRSQQTKRDYVGVNDANSNMSDHLRSSMNKTADKRASKVLMPKIHSEMFFQELDILKAFLTYR